MSPDVSTFQVYTGTVFPKVVSSRLPVITLVFTLAGNFENYPFSGTVSRFPWFAQATQHVKGKEKEKDKEKEKEAKEHKDKEKEKEQKEKDVKEAKEQLKEVETSMNLPTPISQLTQRVNLLEQQLATGTAFIKPEERPPVGGSATQEPPPPAAAVAEEEKQEHR